MSPRNIRLVVEFDGARFHGWQKQPGLRTVQGVIEDAIAEIFQQRCEVIGAGRTDAGVHALRYVCNFPADTEMDSARIPLALMAVLPEDVVVHGAEDVAPGFHARFDALSRRYRYLVSTVPVALRRGSVFFCKYYLDVARMIEAASFLAGCHDFTSFTPALNEANPECDLREILIEDEGGMICVTVEGNRFLHNMVRIIVGTLVEVGRGKIEPADMVAILSARDRRTAGPTMAPHGLAFVSARYSDIPDLR